MYGKYAILVLGIVVLRKYAILVLGTVLEIAL